MFTTLDEDEFESRIKEGREFYLSPMHFSELKDVAQAMGEANVPDDEIGKMIRHHFHDKNMERSGLRIYTLREGDSVERLGLTVIVPNESWYESLHETIVERTGDEEFGQQVRFYHTPDHKYVLQLAKEEIIKRGNYDETTYIDKAHAESVGTQVENNFSINSHEIYSWSGI